MWPDERDFDDELRGHLALSVRERVERGEDPEAARLAALRELGYLPAVRDSMRGVWHSRRWVAVDAFAHDFRIGLRSLSRSPGVALTVVVMLALGIGANAALVSVVRHVLLGPLANRGEDRLIYIRHSAPGHGADNLTFSVPEVQDLTRRATTIAGFAEFSTTGLTMTGLGEPRLVQAGVVNGHYFEIMGLRPVAGRLLEAADDHPGAQPAAVLTHRFWTSTFGGDPSAVGRTVHFGPHAVRIVGVLEPWTAYPTDTEIIANVVTSPHHLGATMTTERTHRMTELFGRLAPGASLEAAQEELTALHDAMKLAHSEAYPESAGMLVRATPLREQITAPARPILLLLLAASGLVFLIACSNAASLMLARSVRREGELAVRAALGASRWALRRTLLAESLVLAAAGAALGVLIARPLVALIARLASLYSPRALDVTIDQGLLGIGAALAIAAAVLLACIPRLPAANAAVSLAQAGAVRMTAGTRRRLRAFATAQIACSFVLLAAAGALLAALAAAHTSASPFELRRVLAVDVPPAATGLGGADVVDLLEEASRRLSHHPDVRGVALGTFVPWRDAGEGMRFQFAAEGYTSAPGEGLPHGRLRLVSPGYFAVLGIPMLAGREFTEADAAGTEPVAIVSRSLAQRLYPSGQAIGRTLWWTEAVLGPPVPRRIVGVVADADDERVPSGAALTLYQPVRQLRFASRLFVRAEGDPYAIAPEVSRIIRELSPEQAIERAATLGDIRAGAHRPDRLYAIVLSGFAAVALLIAAIGIAGVLAFSVHANTRELGLRLAMGSSRRRLLTGVLSEGLVIAAIGTCLGAVSGYTFAALAAGPVDGAQLPGTLPLAGAALVLVTAALLASSVPAAMASRVGLMDALRSE